MSDQSSASKTEKPTPKKLQDARDKGDIAKSRDLTNIALLLLGAVMFWQLGPTMGSRLAVFTELVLSAAPITPYEKLSLIGIEAIKVLLSVSAWIVLPMAIFGLLSEFLQTGPIFALDKVKPKLSNLNPMSGIQRMVSMDSFVELLKSIAKIFVLCVIAWLTAAEFLPDTMKLLQGTPDELGTLLRSQTVMLIGWTMGLFVTIALLDFCYQKYSHGKKQMMSLEDIKQEYKNSEGDPQIKSHRQQLAREWAEEGAVQQARNATALIVNPTHIAIALCYDKDQTPVPTIMAAGIDDVALAMRQAAQKARVPILKNIPLARQLLSETSEGDPVPRELFNIIAEVILWANAIDNNLADPIAAPGEDLTDYSSTYITTESGD